MRAILLGILGALVGTALLRQRAKLLEAIRGNNSAAFPLDRYRGSAASMTARGSRASGFRNDN